MGCFGLTKLEDFAVSRADEMVSRYGGTRTQSDEDRQPDELPDKYEPGHHNLVGRAGVRPASSIAQ